MPALGSLMLVLHGGRALSEFRRLRLLADIQRLAPAIADVSAHHIYLVATARALSAHERDLLERLLNDPTSAPICDQHGELFLVIPRFGTISPWASKATDIAHNCGLTAVTRIERGVAYHVVGAAGLAQLDRARIRHLIHDRMTQAVVSDVWAGAPVSGGCAFRYPS